MTTPNSNGKTVKLDMKEFNRLRGNVRRAMAVYRSAKTARDIAEGNFKTAQNDVQQAREAARRYMEACMGTDGTPFGFI